MSDLSFLEGVESDTVLMRLNGQVKVDFSDEKRGGRRRRTYLDEGIPGAWSFTLNSFIPATNLQIVGKDVLESIENKRTES